MGSSYYLATAVIMGVLGTLMFAQRNHTPDESEWWGRRAVERYEMRQSITRQDRYIIMAALYWLLAIGGVCNWSEDASKFWLLVGLVAGTLAAIFTLVALRLRKLTHTDAYWFEEGLNRPSLQDSIRQSALMTAWAYWFWTAMCLVLWIDSF